MPNRILREGIIESKDVNELSWTAEVFYRRLMSKVDDFGRFTADARLLRAALYPLKLDKVSDRDTQGWLQETAEVGLVKVYEVDGKRFLEMQKFNQRVRSNKSKYPDPPGNDSQTTVTCQPHGSHMTGTCTPKTESETETNKTTTQQNARARLADGQPPSVDAVVAYLAGLPNTGLRGEALAECCQSFFDSGEACGWVDSKSRPLQDWRAAARRWIHSWQRNLTEKPQRMIPPRPFNNQPSQKEDYSL